MEVSAAYADGKISWEQMRKVAGISAEAYPHPPAISSLDACAAASEFATRACSTAAKLRRIGPPATPRRRVVWEEERAIQAVLVRDIFGLLPFREVRIDSLVLAWNDGLVIKLAHAVYEKCHLIERTLHQDRLALLADALEEAGATDTFLLEHLRGPGPHVRGCFALDRILGRE